MQIQVLSDRAIVTDRNSSVVLLGRDAFQLQYRNGGSPQAQVWFVDVYFDTGTGPVNPATKARTDIYSIDLSRVAAGGSQRSWTNSEQGAVNAILALTPILRAGGDGGGCCPFPSPVVIDGGDASTVFSYIISGPPAS